MAKIAFLGLGQMGTPMATRLLQAGHELTGLSIATSRSPPQRERGWTRP